MPRNHTSQGVRKCTPAPWGRQQIMPAVVMQEEDEHGCARALMVALNEGGARQLQLSHGQVVILAMAGSAALSCLHESGSQCIRHGKACNRLQSPST
jgi:hypothetical protein